MDTLLGAKKEPEMPHIVVAIEKNGRAHLKQRLANSGKKKRGYGARLWMRLDMQGNSEILELDKTMIMESTSIPSRDLRALGPVFSNSSNILARDRAMVVNLEFVKAIVMAEEVLILEPTNSAIVSFIDQLRKHLPCQAPEMGETSELPFEFMVLEVALKAVVGYLHSKVLDLERVAYPSLDELTLNVSTSKLDHVRSLKGDLTRLLARVQKVREEVESLLDEDERMVQLYLTRKSMHNACSESSRVSRVTSRRSSDTGINENDVEEMEMLLEAYFMQIDHTRNKLLAVREYIDDTEDYVNIQLDNQRNDMIQFHLTMITASFAISVGAFGAGVFGMNIPIPLYDMNGIFEPYLGALLSVCTILFFSVCSYAKWGGSFTSSASAYNGE